MKYQVTSRLFRLFNVKERKTMKIDISTIFLGLMTLIMGAGVPAIYQINKSIYKIDSRLVRVEVLLKTSLETHELVHELEKRLIRLEPRKGR